MTPWRIRNYDEFTDKGLPEYDHTVLAAVCTCPTFGITRYIQHRTLAEGVGPGRTRHLALETGSACHLAFAAERLYRLGWTQGHRDHAMYHGARIFGKDVWEGIVAPIDGEDQRTDRLRVVLGGFEASGYTDDPSDKRRTVSNIEEALTNYSDNVDPIRKVWLADPKDPMCMVGVEIPFRLVIEFFDTVPVGLDTRGLQEGPAIRSFCMTGRIDGIEIDEVAGVVFEDNKTSSRLSEAWKDQWHLSHQMTGYSVAIDHIMGQQPKPSRLTRSSYGAVRFAVRGLAIPPPRSIAEGLHNETYSRYPYHVERWAKWFRGTAKMIEKYQGDVLNAPMFTHSCSRYYQTCQFVPFCDAPDDERAEMLAEMQINRWSPLYDEEGIER